ncbi:hypothetical protein EVAR_38298_1 [Eumeta japonica]|uniref:Uncharacterized protein n=1 Tax=Eumeta variegata TaxID=151549 RepID=A0A4C1W738_EUMVA|nr:hypothetical protein EVAR_38298_1 [Eumeta japonica]
MVGQPLRSSSENLEQDCARHPEVAIPTARCLRFDSRMPRAIRREGVVLIELETGCRLRPRGRPGDACSPLASQKKKKYILVALVKNEVSTSAPRRVRAGTALRRFAGIAKASRYKSDGNNEHCGFGT